MSKTEGESVPGLGVWGVVLAVLLCIGLYVWKLPSKEKKENRQISAWLMKRSLPPGKKPLVLMIGTSLTACGLDSAEQLQKNIRQRWGQDVQVMKVWKLNAARKPFPICHRRFNRCIR